MKTAGSRGIPIRALYIGVGLCVLLAVVALATRGTRPSGGDASSDRALPGNLFDYMFTVSILLAIGMVLILAWLRAQSGPEARKKWSGRQMFLFMVTVAGVCAAAVMLSEFLRENPESPLAKLLNRETAPVATTGAEGRPIRSRQPEFEWPAVLIAGALVAVGFGVYRVGRRRRPQEERTLREDIAAILDDTLEKLSAEEDPRRAVILAYAWMERTLAAHGLPRTPSEAPLEYLARVLIDLEASRDSVFELTALFERAKFSLHEVDEEMKHEAISSLTAVRDELRGSDESQ